MTVSEPVCPRCTAPNRPGARFCRACGTELTARPSRRLSVVALVRRVPRRRRLLVAGIAVAATVLACGGYVVLQDTWYRPEAPVRQLFAALAARDTAALTGLGDCGAVCEDGGLSRGYQPPTGVEILGVTYGAPDPDDPTRRPNHNGASVHVRYRVAGSTYDDAVGVDRSNVGLLRPWRIAGAPGWYLQIVSNGEPHAMVAGAAVDTVKADPDLPLDVGRIFVPPGVYTVSGASSALWESTPVTVTVAGTAHRSGKSGQRVALDLRVKPSVVDEVQRQVRARIDLCATRKAFIPKADPADLGRDCPFSADENYTSTEGLQWTVVDYPRIELAVADDQTVSVRTVGAGHARLDYSYTFDVFEPRRWTPTSQTVEISPRGQVVEDHGAVVWNG